VIDEGVHSRRPGTATVATFDPARILDDLDAGRRRAAWPDPAAEDGWRIDPTVKTDILARFADRATRQWEVGPLAFRDRIGLPTKALLAGSSDAGSGADEPQPDRSVRIVPGGTSVRAGAYLGPGVVVMPPAFINVGAWIGEDSMVDSHVLVGSCAQIGARVHLAAAVQIGGVLEPPGARPVIVEDDVFVGAGSALLEGVLVGSGAVIAAGVVLTGTSRLFDLVRDRVIAGSHYRPLVVPTRSVVVPGTRPLDGPFARRHGLAVATAVIVKDRDAGTDARTALESALRAGPGGATP
jgi:2,3,4,5-tetrahydropyridine-2-carboxylate N-succinyltransferase